MALPLQCNPGRRLLMKLLSYIGVPDFSKVLRLLFAWYDESLLLLFQVFVYNSVVWIISALRLDKFLLWLTPILEDYASYLPGLGKYVTKSGERVPYSLVGIIDPHFQAPINFYHPRDFPKTEAGYGLLDNPANIHFMALASRLSFEDQRIIQDIVRYKWRCSWVSYQRLLFPPEVQLRNGRAVTVVPETSWYCFHTDEAVVLVFRGTSPLSLINWESDFEALLVHRPGLGRVHSGFYGALFDQPVAGQHCAFDAIVELLSGTQLTDMRLVVTGHSLGAALAALFVQALAVKQPELSARVDAVYTFGEPRVGDEEFVDLFYKRYPQRCFRCVYASDLVTRAPPGFLYVHHPAERYVTSFFLTRHFILRGEVDADEIETWRRIENRWAYVFSWLKVLRALLERRFYMFVVVRLLLSPVPSVCDHLMYEPVLKRYLKTRAKPSQPAPPVWRTDCATCCPVPAT